MSRLSRKADKPKEKIQRRKRPENGTTRSIFHPSIKTSGKLKIMNIQGTKRQIVWESLMTCCQERAIPEVQKAWMTTSYFCLVYPQSVGNPIAHGLLSFVCVHRYYSYCSRTSVICPCPKVLILLTDFCNLLLSLGTVLVLLTDFCQLSLSKRIRIAHGLLSFALFKGTRFAHGPLVICPYLVLIWITLNEQLPFVQLRLNVHRICL